MGCRFSALFFFLVLFWCSAPSEVQEMQAARDQRMLAVSIVEAGREAAASMLGMMWTLWRQAHQSLSSPSSVVPATFSWWTPKHQREKSLVSVDVLFVEILVILWVLMKSSQAALPARVARIALQRKGAGKKLLRALRLMTRAASSGLGRAVDSEASVDVLNGKDNFLDGD